MKTPETVWFQVFGNFETWAQSLGMELQRGRYRPSLPKESLKNLQTKRAQRLFLLYALFSFKGILNIGKEAFFLWIDF